MKNIFAIIFISINCAALASEPKVELPDQTILFQRLQEEGLSKHAIRTAEIDTAFAKKTVISETIKSTVDELCSNVLKHSKAQEKEDFVAKHLEEHRQKIYAALLLEHPEALKDLQTK